MRCCVPSCKNDSRHSSKSQGITFHAFPTTPSHRTAWLKALGKERWRPRERSAVCSEHFLAADLYFTKSGLRKVRPGAAPFVSQEFPRTLEYGSRIVQACRMCLVIDHRLLSMRRYNLDKPFERLTGLSLNEDDRLPQKLCSECARRLLNADNFRNTTLKVHSLLLEILNKQNVLTTETLKTINRENHHLTSPLSHVHNTPDHYDLQIEHSEVDHGNTDTNKTEESLQMDVKTENNFVSDQKILDQLEFEVDEGETENDQELDIKTENSVFANEKEENIFVDEIKDYDEFNDSNDDNDTTFIADKNFESDDSLPLEVTRKRKKKQKEKSVKTVRKKCEKKPAEPKIDRRRKPFLNQDLNETLFTVTDLTFEEQIAEIQKRQESDNYKHSVFKCTECFKGFLDRGAYKDHMTRHTNECGEHRCDICRTHFKHSHALRKHITAHHTQRFSCNQCPYVTTHRQTARLHERWHKGTRYRCPHCPEEFVKFTTYMGHVRIKHPSDFVCSLCGYSFVSAKGIQLHKKLKHRADSGTVPEDGPFCEQCNVRFASQEAYRKHLSVSARHTTKETREANKANKGKRTKEHREREKTTKDEENQEEGDESKKMYPSQLRKAEGPIPCEQCGLQLEDSRAYHGHFRRMHPDKNRTKYPSMKSPCMCELCGRIFQSYALLKDHRWVHTGERPFQCSQCDKSFRMKQRLVAHRRVHAAVRASYSCSLCHKHFSTHSNRQRHMFIHTGLKPFSCEMCGKGFKHASEKRAHVTYVHLKKPWPKRARHKPLNNQMSSMPPQSEGGAETNVAQPLWPGCEPKLSDINILDDKPLYYNIKL